MNLLLGVALVLGLMIMIHEWGHFIVARLFKVRVDVFSIGFGPRLFGWKSGATDWRVSALPFGGYVRMAGQDMSDVDAGDKPPTGSSDELMSKPRWQRALISFAGPAVNLIFPILALAVLFIVFGVPHSAYLDQPVQVVALSSKSDAQTSPFRPGDKILSLNGVANPTWEQAAKAIKDETPGSALTAEVENGGVKRSVQTTLGDSASTDRLLGYPPLLPVLDEVAPSSPANHAGLKEGDTIQSVDGQKIQYWGQFVDRVRGSEGKPVQLDLLRNGQTIQTQVTPAQGVTESGEKLYQVGVAVRDQTSYRRERLREGLHDAVVMTGERISETVGVVAKLFSGRVSVKQLSGVVGISRAAGEAVRKGALAVLSLMVLISVNLGILNLLPIPILDGGNILLLAIEGVMRRDLSMAFKERFVQVGFVFLLAIMAYAVYNDVMRMLPIHS
ncbi:MAG TPA: RIP metalloprotease RseP [Verrucomicrobiae bacterium]|jgi:regulator of sigma E protease|nr:RIP metalloprotease RseP [Verrucomicrobiae bacterium]